MGAYALGDIWPSPADVLRFFGKMLLALGVALSAGALLVLLVKPETAPPDGAPAGPAEPVVLPQRLLSTGALSLPVHAAVLYLASFVVSETGAGQVLRLYGGLGLPLLGLCVLLWRTRRPSASLGLGLSWVLALALLLKPALHRGHTAGQQIGRQQAAQNQYEAARSTDRPTSRACPWTEQVYDRVAQMPTFPGGDSVLRRAIRDELHYPLQYLDRGGAAAVRLSYVVHPDGSVCGVQILESPGRGFGYEATRVLQQLPPFSPGRLPDGRFVAVRCTLVIDFPPPPAQL
ncbi:energy transducer TonB [Hymenobacter edaphi]|uniref:energy transducer TonB n=1 Tax=Hymenobacter edaphi TaxID=2211146 RepID=UPI001403E7AC|nr:energy transducer TonB [Hymenobacter edaphi]